MLHAIDGLERVAGVVFVVPKVHMLLHVARCQARNGSLSAYSMFSIERANRLFVQYAANCATVPEQVVSATAFLQNSLTLIAAGTAGFMDFVPFLPGGHVHVLSCEHTSYSGLHALNIGSARVSGLGTVSCLTQERVEPSTSWNSSLAVQVRDQVLVAELQSWTRTFLVADICSVLDVVASWATVASRHLLAAECTVLLGRLRQAGRGRALPNGMRDSVVGEYVAQRRGQLADLLMAVKEICGGLGWCTDELQVRVRRSLREDAELGSSAMYVSDELGVQVAVTLDDVKHMVALVPVTDLDGAPDDVGADVLLALSLRGHLTGVGSE